MPATSAASHVIKLSNLRALLRKQGVSGLIVPRTDEFQGEYVPACAERLLWLTGFAGSWGTAVVAPRDVALIVDGRYTIQAARQARAIKPKLLSPENEVLLGFLSKSFKAGDTLGFDPWLASISEARRLSRLAADAKLKLAACKSNPVDEVWPDRPAAPQNPIYHHPQKFSGASHSEKLDVIAAALRQKKADAVLLSDPHSVAWLLNLRGSDVDHTPLALLRALVFASGKATLFVDKSRCTKQVLETLKGRVKFSSAETLGDEIAALGKKAATVMVDPQFCPEALHLALVKAKAKIIEASDPCSLPRARKNATEQNATRKAHIRDGAALTNFLCWLDANAQQGQQTEKSAENKLSEFRQATGKLKDLSFGSISASGPNAALPHYHVEGNIGRKLKPDDIYLIDSGGQYQDGTTDVTRTVVLGQASAEKRRHFTLVLKGMIAVSMARFPQGTTGVQIDTLARAALWQQGFDFDHGTGHGVGSYLSVHEGPARISKAGHVALEPGMILSNEPGYYRPGHYGIRIENLLLVKPASKVRGGDRAMLSFETLTFAPIDKRLVDSELLTKAELHWLDLYHAEVLTKIGRHVNANTKAWLEAACAPLTRKV